MSKQDTQITELKNQINELMNARPRTFEQAMLGFIPSVKDENGQLTETVKVGDTVIQNADIAQTVVTTRMLQIFNAKSATMTAIAMGKTTKEMAKAEGFADEQRLFQNALPNLSSDRIKEYWTVGRIFGNFDTMKWKSPIPETANISNLSKVAKSFVNCRKLNTATEVDVQSRFDAFVHDYLEKYPELLRAITDKQTELQKVITQIKNTIDGNTDDGQPQKDGDQNQNSDGQNQTSDDQNQTSGDQNQTDNAREAVNLLFDYFKGNKEAVDLLYTLMAMIPSGDQTQTDDQSQTDDQTQTETDDQTQTETNDQGEQ